MSYLCSILQRGVESMHWVWLVLILPSWGPSSQSHQKNLSTKHFQSCYFLFAQFFNSTKPVSSPPPHLQIPSTQMLAQLSWWLSWWLPPFWSFLTFLSPLFDQVLLLVINLVLNQLLGEVLVLATWLLNGPFGSWTVFLLHLALVFGLPFLCFGLQPWH